MAQRLFDFSIATFLLLLLLPAGVIIAFCIVLDSRGGVFFLQERMGLNGKLFKLYKFRTMHKAAYRLSPITTSNDSRITRAGVWLRKYKLDELPQLLNVLLNDMSLVGPRPEVPRYASFYTGAYASVLSVKPGITDPASLEYIDENELLVGENPEAIYTSQILPHKLEIARRYVQHRSLALDVSILLKTAGKIIFR